MNRIILIGAATLSLAISSMATAQVTSTEREMPNGNVRTTTRVDTPSGTAVTRTIDRPNGTRTVIHRRTDEMGNERIVRHDRGDIDRREMGHHRGYAWGHHRTCVTRWHHGHRVTRCWARR
ncbi:MAG: hypothetical protein JF593_12710 [Novosphingobium sp.]|nr:hypothetical protein [Novosphingobium sp.]